MVISFAYAKSTKLAMSWKNPHFASQRFNQVLVMGVSANPEVRADFEDAFSANLQEQGVNAIAGNQILLRPASKETEMDYLRAQIREHKIDAVVVTRLVDIKTNITYIPGDNYFVAYPYYHTFYGYYGSIYSQVYTPDYLVEDKTVRIETNFYATTPPDGDLIWTATTDTFNPKSPKKVIKPLVKLLVEQMRKEGVI